MATKFSNLPVYFCFLLAFTQENVVFGNRKVSVTWNPDCPSGFDCAHHGLEEFPSSANSLLHFTVRPSQESNNSQTAHILLSTVGGPAILMLLTDDSARVKVEWQRYLNESDRAFSVRVDRPVHHSMAVMFTRVWRFNDGHDLSNVDSPSPADAIESIPLEGLLWKNVTIANGTTFTAALTSSGEGDDDYLLGENGTLKMTMEVFNAAGRSDSLPRLPHSDTGCQIDIELINIKLDNFSQPRFAVEAAAVSNSSMSAKADVYRLEEEETMDDEYTPGVFRTYYLTMPADDGFLMWKPVAYRAVSRSFDSFTRAHHGDANMVANLSLLNSLNMSNVISAFYGSDFPLHAVAFNMTLGMQKDKFYSNYRYLVWSLGVGWGSKPAESLSTLVIVLLIVSSAFPTLALLIGIPYLIIRRKRASVPYEDLIEDS